MKGVLDWNSYPSAKVPSGSNEPSLPSRSDSRGNHEIQIHAIVYACSLEKML